GISKRSSPVSSSASASASVAMLLRVPSVCLDHALARQAPRGCAKEDLSLIRTRIGGANTSLTDGSGKLAELETACEPLLRRHLTQQVQPHLHRLRIGVGKLAGVKYGHPLL